MGMFSVTKTKSFEGLREEEEFPCYPAVMTPLEELQVTKVPRTNVIYCLEVYAEGRFVDEFGPYWASPSEFQEIMSKSPYRAPDGGTVKVVLGKLTFSKV